MSDKILVLSPLSAAATDHLQHNYDTLLLYDSDDPKKMIAEHKESIRVLIAGQKSRVSSHFVDQLSALELICAPLPALGNIRIDDQQAKTRNVRIAPVGNIPVADYVELTLGLMLALSRRLVEINMMFRTGHWRSSTKRTGLRLSGKKAVIFGDESIRTKLADILKTMNLDVLDKQEFTSFEAVAAEVDFFIMLPGLEQDTDSGIDQSVFTKLGRNGAFICTGSYNCVNEEDLLIALSNKTIMGAALDVYTNVDDTPEALLTMDHVVMTPSVSGMTLEAFEDMGHSVIDVVDEFFRKQ